MSSSNSPTDADPQPILAADTSVVISLNASGRAPEILRALQARVVVTENVLDEIWRGESKGHNDGEQLQKLIDQGIVFVVSLNEAQNLIYATLIEGAAGRTLDDGEASIIAYSSTTGSVAVLDERKARGVCASDYASLALSCTAAILVHADVGTALGRQGQMEAMLSALRNGRMRVPPEVVEEVIALIGEDNAASCSSLRKVHRAGKDAR